MAPGVLAQVLRHLPPITHPDVLVGLNTADDAGVFKLNNELALVQTVDYFTPVVDDAFDFGRIAAANALSDVYAMGGRPILGLNLVGFPVNNLPLEILVEILRGGAIVAAEAGIVIIGGHTIDDPEPKYGMSVTGLIHPAQVVSNAGARVGDELVLTKPLGIGIITTAIKREAASPETIDRAVELMATLNKAAAEAMVEIGVNACTDITGFGFLGHLSEMTSASGVGAEIALSKVPVLAEAWEFANRGFIPGGSRRNLEFLAGTVLWDEEISEIARLVLCDAQTSGGLLISVPEEKKEALVALLKAKGVSTAETVGRIVEEKECRIRVIP